MVQIRIAYTLQGVSVPPVPYKHLLRQTFPLPPLKKVWLFQGLQQASLPPLDSYLSSETTPLHFAAYLPVSLTHSNHLRNFGQPYLRLLKSAVRQPCPVAFFAATADPPAYQLESYPLGLVYFVLVLVHYLLAY